MTLILKRANKNRLGAIDWGPNDFDVCESNRCIGRIFLSIGDWGEIGRSRIPIALTRDVKMCP